MTTEHSSMGLAVEGTTAHAPQTAEAPPTVVGVTALIKRLLAEYLQANRPDFTEAITEDMSFDYIGLDSLARVELLTGLDRVLGITLDPTAAFDFVTVRALAGYVCSMVSGTPLDVKNALGI